MLNINTFVFKTSRNASFLLLLRGHFSNMLPVDKMEEYKNVSIEKKDTNFIVFNLESAAVKESKCLEYRSPVFTFDDPKDECYVSFVSVLSKERLTSPKIASMTLHIISKGESTDEPKCQTTPDDMYTYQVVCSILNKPEFGVLAFQSPRFGPVDQLKHWKFFSVEILSKVVSKNGRVQLCFDVTRFSKSSPSSIGPSFVQQNQDPMLKLFSFSKEDEYIDVEIKVEDKIIKAHRNMLAARSPVFHAMFKSKMQEEQTGVIKIENFKHETIENMLYFMYTNTIKNLEENYKELFEAAHYFDVVDLEIHCKNYMLSNITVENVTTLAELAEKYNLKKLLFYINKFIKNNEAQVIKNADYVTYLLSNLSVTNVARCLTLADKYKLKDFKTTLKIFVKQNIKEVIKDSQYRYLYMTHTNLLLEIDEFMANYSETEINN